ncbi:hypothetical protein AOL_s00078g385 [Orbilia oligospora ATCC 24927]|uniref:Uncharacterized protein n=1 Tax=Arthrobotrys oligospora (strain ATCC 24927 / CBS 115.81 / DSM 1491) TaxID=756982 RepID=G1XBT8_ARTOA|nr:hypothetical protein AOL_s00078g385 [Orbilia oligospora ATCC 24927]EGX49352.1 hypothetical protein AOL_s00078g385 [Orbilia oligospora ATCC 24927]
MYPNAVEGEIARPMPEPAACLRRRNIDMRYRFRGNNPLGTAQELHQNQESVPQLYGGRPALPPMPGTDGNDDQKKE